MKAETKKILGALLAWDRTRVAGLKQRRPDLNVADYEERQARAEAAIVLPPGKWPQEIREHFQVLLEVHGDMAVAGGAPIRNRIRRTHNVGNVAVPPPPPDVNDFERVRAVAREIGVLPVLERAGASIWRRP